jgi:hypothetical protein
LDLSAYYAPSVKTVSFRVRDNVYRERVALPLTSDGETRGKENKNQPYFGFRYFIESRREKKYPWRMLTYRRTHVEHNMFFELIVNDVTHTRLRNAPPRNDAYLDHSVGNDCWPYRAWMRKLRTVRVRIRTLFSAAPRCLTRGRQAIYIGVLKFQTINQWCPAKKIFLKSLRFKNSGVKIIIRSLRLIFIKNYNIRSMKIKVDRVQGIASRQSPNPVLHRVLMGRWRSVRVVPTNSFVSCTKNYINIIIVNRRISDRNYVLEIGVPGVMGGGTFMPRVRFIRFFFHTEFLRRFSMIITTYQLVGRISSARKRFTACAREIISTLTHTF